MLPVDSYYPALLRSSRSPLRHATIITCGTLAGAIIPEMIKVFTSTNSGHVREVVTASKEGGASLNVLAGLTAGNFSAYWMGVVLAVLMGIAYKVSGTVGFDAIMAAPAVFAFGRAAPSRSFTGAAAPPPFSPRHNSRRSSLPSATETCPA